MLFRAMAARNGCGVKTPSHKSSAEMSKALAHVILLFLLPVCPCLAQLHWSKVDTAYGVLPSSLHVYRSNDSLHGFPSIAYYVSARLKDKRMQFTTSTGQGKRFTPAQ